ncbi:MAG TPA: excisionase [Arsenophonus sp.]
MRVIARIKTKITLAKWNARRDRPRRIDSVRGWVRNGLLL